MNEVEDVQPGHIYQPGNKNEVRLVYRVLSGPYRGRHQKSFSLTKWGESGAWEEAHLAKAYMLRTGRLPPSFASPYSRSKLTNASSNSAKPAGSCDMDEIVINQKVYGPSRRKMNEGVRIKSRNSILQMRTNDTVGVGAATQNLQGVSPKPSKRSKKCSNLCEEVHIASAEKHLSNFRTDPRQRSNFQVTQDCKQQQLFVLPANSFIDRENMIREKSDAYEGNRSKKIIEMQETNIMESPWISLENSRIDKNFVTEDSHFRSLNTSPPMSPFLEGNLSPSSHLSTLGKYWDKSSMFDPNSFSTSQRKDNKCSSFQLLNLPSDISIEATKTNETSGNSGSFVNAIAAAIILRQLCMNRSNKLCETNGGNTVSTGSLRENMVANEFPITKPSNSVFQKPSQGVGVCCGASQVNSLIVPKHDNEGRKPQLHRSTREKNWNSSSDDISRKADVYKLFLEQINAGTFLRKGDKVSFGKSCECGTSLKPLISSDLNETSCANICLEDLFKFILSNSCTQETEKSFGQKLEKQTREENSATELGILEASKDLDKEEKLATVLDDFFSSPTSMLHGHAKCLLSL